MSNTATRRPSAATMRKMTGIAADATPADVVHAWEALGSPRTMADAKRATPAPAPAKGKGKPAATTSKPKPAPANCGCGCGQPTITARAAFLAGHDARLAGVLGRAIGSGSATAEQTAQYAGLTDLLKGKTDKIAATARRAQAVKDAKATAKAAYDKALADALATA